MNRLVLASAIAMALSSTAYSADVGQWGYEGELAPQNWGTLAEGYAVCDSGKMQSPIDLAETNVVAPVSVSVDWKPSALTMLNNGKTIQADFPEGSYMTSSGKVFNLLQVHFHTPSEHTIDGRTYPLVAHFVHATDAGQLGVLGIMYEAGEQNMELQKLIDAAALVGAQPSQLGDVSFNPNLLLPGELEVYRYMGSLTTPPCSEGVNWHVAADTVEASAEQLAALEEIMGNNARPVQHLHSRLVIAPE